MEKSQELIGILQAISIVAKSLAAKLMQIAELEAHLPMVRIAVLYAAAYLYEHREQADHGELVGTLRSLLFGIRKEVF